MPDRRRTEIPLHVRVYPWRHGGPRLAKNCRPAPGQPIALDLGTVRVISRDLLELALEVTAQAPTVTVAGGVGNVPDVVRYFLRQASTARVLDPDDTPRRRA